MTPYAGDQPVTLHIYDFCSDASCGEADRAMRLPIGISIG